MPLIIVTHWIGRLVFGNGRRDFNLLMPLDTENTLDSPTFVLLPPCGDHDVSQFLSAGDQKSRFLIVKDGPMALSRVSGGDVIIVENLEDFFLEKKNRTWLCSKLREWLHDKAKIVITSHIDPSYWTTLLSSGSPDSGTNLELSEDEMRDWLKILYSFDKRALAVTGISFQESEMNLQWLISTMEERCVLANLATCDTYNPKNFAVMSSLINRGLVDGHTLRLTEASVDGANFNSFREFILEHADLSAIRTWQTDEKSELWSAMWPTLAIIIGVLVFFVVSAGRDAVDTALAVMGSIVAALPLILSIFGAVRGNED